MTSGVLSAADERALAALESGLAGLLSRASVAFGGGRSGAQLIELIRRLEVVDRRSGGLRHGLINELDASGEARRRCVPDTATLLVRELHISPG